MADTSQKSILEQAYSIGIPEECHCCGNPDGVWMLPNGVILCNKCKEQAEKL